MLKLSGVWSVDFGFYSHFEEQYEMDMVDVLAPS